jgi:hypothetical protein
MSFRVFSALPIAFVLLLGCQDQQYVSPDTANLSITNLDTGIERVNRCNFIPVLLGNQVKSRYVVEGSLKAVISLTRDKVTVSFEGEASLPEPWTVESTKFREKFAESSDTPPDNYDVRLSSQCKVDEP